jgi:hypothetical protein
MYVIAWAQVADPVLQSALEYGATIRATAARTRVRCLRRRCLVMLSCLAAVAICTRAVLWLVL